MMKFYDGFLTEQMLRDVMRDHVEINIHGNPVILNNESYIRYMMDTKGYTRDEIINDIYI